MVLKINKIIAITNSDLASVFKLFDLASLSNNFLELSPKTRKNKDSNKNIMPKINKTIFMILILFNAVLGF